jgi:hypothetical protein
MDSKKWNWTVSEFADFMNISVNAIRMHIQRGNLEVVVLGQQRILRPEGLRFKDAYKAIHRKRAADKKQPLRKPNCLRYEECLTITARDNETFGCVGCTKYEPTWKTLEIFNAVDSDEMPVLIPKSRHPR